METIIENKGQIRMLYNYFSNDQKLYRKNQIYNYSKILKVDNKICNCQNDINTYYIVGESKIPTSRSVKI
jgi:hypothetical protein